MRLSRVVLIAFCLKLKALNVVDPPRRERRRHVNVAAREDIHLHIFAKLPDSSRVNSILTILSCRFAARAADICDISHKISVLTNPVTNNSSTCPTPSSEIATAIDYVNIFTPLISVIYATGDIRRCK